MKRIGKYFALSLLLTFTFFININIAKAATGRMTISTSQRSVTVGSNFTVTVNVSSTDPLGAYEFVLGYNSSLVRLNSGNLKVVDYGNGSKRSASHSYTFTSIGSGTATFRVENASLLDYKTEKECLSTRGTASVTMQTQAQIQATYSKNNNLSGLSVLGGELSPAFSASVLEYNIELPVDTETTTIEASVADKAASVEGTGEISVLDGLNKVQVVVTAQNGDKKTYTLNITVIEQDPIKVKIKEKDYTVVRKKPQVDVPIGFEEQTIVIEEQSVTTYINNKSKLTLVALKNKDEVVKLFIYDEKTKNYTEYIELKADSLSLFLIDNNDKLNIPKEYKKTNLKKLNIDFDAWQIKNNKDYYLVYGLNTKTGIKGLYLLDSKEMTFQRYYTDEVKLKDEQLEKYEYIIIGLFFPLIILLLKGVFNMFKPKHKKQKKEKEVKPKKEKKVKPKKEKRKNKRIKQNRMSKDEQIRRAIEKEKENM